MNLFPREKFWTGKGARHLFLSFSQYREKAQGPARGRACFPNSIRVSKPGLGEEQNSGVKVGPF